MHAATILAAAPSRCSRTSPCRHDRAAAEQVPLRPASRSASSATHPARCTSQPATSRVRVVCDPPRTEWHTSLPMCCTSSGATARGAAKGRDSSNAMTPGRRGDASTRPAPACSHCRNRGTQRMIATTPTQPAHSLAWDGHDAGAYFYEAAAWTRAQQRLQSYQRPAFCTAAQWTR